MQNCVHSELSFYNIVMHHDMKLGCTVGLLYERPGPKYKPNVDYKPGCDLVVLIYNLSIYLKSGNKASIWRVTVFPCLR